MPLIIKEPLIIIITSIATPVAILSQASCTILLMICQISQKFATLLEIPVKFNKHVTTLWEIPRTFNSNVKKSRIPHSILLPPCLKPRLHVSLKKRPSDCRRSLRHASRSSAGCRIQTMADFRSIGRPGLVRQRVVSATILLNSPATPET